MATWMQENCDKNLPQAWILIDGPTYHITFWCIIRLYLYVGILHKQNIMLK